MSGPDRIWAWPRLVWKTDGGTWSDHELPRSTEYIRRDPAVLAALPEVQALIAGAFEAAARLCWAQVKRRAEQATSAEDGSVQQARWIAGRIQAEELAKAMEALIPADAIAARDAMIAAAVDMVRAQAFVEGREAGMLAERQACAAIADGAALEIADKLTPTSAVNALRNIVAAIRKRGEG